MIYSLERYDGHYKVDEAGHVYGWYDNILKPKLTNSGYHQVGCYFKGKYYWELVHRLVYEGVSGGPIPDGLQINHKDGNRVNNAISNLELVTPKQNAEHRKDTLKTYGKNKLGRNGRAKPVLDVSTGINYGSLLEACTSLGINYKTARDYMRGARKNKTNLEYIKN